MLRSLRWRRKLASASRKLAFVLENNPRVVDKVGFKQFMRRTLRRVDQCASTPHLGLWQLARVSKLRSFGKRVVCSLLYLSKKRRRRKEGDGG
jgi:hypothetical protein